MIAGWKPDRSTWIERTAIYETASICTRAGRELPVPRAGFTIEGPRFVENQSTPVNQQQPTESALRPPYSISHRQVHTLERLPRSTSCPSSRRVSPVARDLQLRPRVLHFCLPPVQIWPSCNELGNYLRRLELAGTEEGQAFGGSDPQRVIRVLQQTVHILRRQSFADRIGSPAGWDP